MNSLGSFTMLGLREELIKRKDGTLERYCFFEAEDRSLEIAPVLTANSCESVQLEDGLYLSRKSTISGEGALKAFQVYESTPFTASSANELSTALENLFLSENYLVADSKGNIVYQQTGWIPSRPSKYSGLFPIPAWWEPGIWIDMLKPSQLCKITNPSQDILYSANDLVCEESAGMNVHMGTSRVERIRDLLTNSPSRHSISASKKLQSDAFSVFAQKLLTKLRSCKVQVFHGSCGDRMETWDFVVEDSEIESSIFESFHEHMLDHAFGSSGFGTHIWKHIFESTVTGAEFLHWFDQVLLQSEDTCRAAHSFFESCEVESMISWGEKHQYWMRNQFLMDVVAAQGHNGLFVSQLFETVLMKLGNAGPYHLPGARDVIAQSIPLQNSSFVFGQSWRFVTDLASDQVESMVLGGVSVSMIIAKPCLQLTVIP
eukprot:TRINITY_DN1093_c0_g2_i2.p1 TRINITY_DN1093_c0_g2~~TRINITY_DN1093_c0_g2_i2.p1  ORF type:complete len:431 (-),score=96.49 TRINITY_DN1093_c0_g2_i2:443-1735(-)